MIARATQLSCGPLVVISGGGTGGHLFPAIAAVAELRRFIPEARFLYLGTRRAIDGHILGQLEAEVVQQPLSPPTGSPLRWPEFLLELRRAKQWCRKRFAWDRPALVLGTGGYSSLPGVLEARRAGVPTVLLNPDAVPGKANRYLARKADAVFSQFERTREHFPRTVRVLALGCPVRAGFVAASREDGIRRFELNTNKLTLLVTGASQGAKTINDAVIAQTDLLRSRPEWQVLHLTGESQREEVERAYQRQGVAARVLAFTHHMAEAMAAADVVISRAGASTLAELTAVGRASILMPYPHHRDQHQLANAVCLAEQDAAQIVRDEMEVSRNAPALRGALSPLLDDAHRRNEMASAARSMGRVESAVNIARTLLEIMEKNDRGEVRDSMEAGCGRAR